MNEGEGECYGISVRVRVLGEGYGLLVTGSCNDWRKSIRMVGARVFG